MALGSVMGELVLVVTTMLVTATLVIVGPRRIGRALRGLRWRLRELLAPLAVLLGVLLFRIQTQEITPVISWRIIDINITPHIFRVEATLFERNPVAVIQAFESEPLTSFFVFIYMYGYVFLISFPFIAYFALDETDEMATLLFAFAINYAIGYVFYTVFISFGPRNFDPNLFENILYRSFPQARYLTGTVNAYTNVFPSLHTSLSMTTMLLAWFTRDEYPLWFPVSAFFAVSVALSTMYLGIHWFADVVGGICLALFSVYVARRYSVSDVAASARQYMGRRIGAVGDPSRK